jgi:hypothetical protein
LLLWLILIPVRAHAKRKRDLDWLSFKPDSHNIDEDGAQSIFRTPRAGVGEDDDDPGKAGIGMQSPQSFQMHEVGSGVGGMHSLYGHLDSATSGGGEMSPEQAHSAYYAPYGGNPPGLTGHDPNQYAAYYPAGQANQSANAAYVHISPQASPEMSAAHYRNGQTPDQYAMSTQQLAYAPAVGTYGQPYGAQQNSTSQYASVHRTPSSISQTLHPRPSRTTQEGHSGSISLQRQGTDATLHYSQAGQVNATDNLKAFTSGGASYANERTQGDPHALHRRRESKDQEKSDDVCLPYDRPLPSESPHPHGSSNNLHLANPDS